MMHAQITTEFHRLARGATIAKIGIIAAAISGLFWGCAQFPPPHGATRSGASGTNTNTNSGTSTSGKQSPGSTAEGAVASARARRDEPLRFVVSFPDRVRRTSADARVLLFLAKSKSPEPRRAGDSFNFPAVYAIDVTNLPPNDLVVFLPEKFRGYNALAFPVPLSRLEPGTYYAQAVIDLDSTRRDYNSGPGNLYSAVVPCEVRGSTGGSYELVADQMIEESTPMDTDWVKLVEVRSRLLSDFHGRDVKLRAAVILPSTYHERAGEKFPALYVIPGFGGRHTAAWDWIKSERGQKWQKGEVPLQMARIVLDPDVPLGHSVFANSANNGPVGDALVRELIPEIERRFRCIPESWARYVAGHSSGGWASLWLQVSYSDIFGGCWSTAPDPVDFRSFQTFNIYSEKNGHWTKDGLARPVARSRTGVTLTFPQFNLWEHVIGYGGQLDSFDAVFSPRGTNGLPQRLMDKLSGTIDRRVANHWRRYDIRKILEDNWATLGPDLLGKLHVIAANSDTYYLEDAVDRLKEFLRKTDFGGYVEILPGDHGSVMSEAVRNRIEREIAEKFADEVSRPRAKP